MRCVYICVRVAITATAPRVITDAAAAAANRSIILTRRGQRRAAAAAAFVERCGGWGTLAPEAKGKSRRVKPLEKPDSAARDGMIFRHETTAERRSVGKEIATDGMHEWLLIIWVFERGFADR